LWAQCGVDGVNLLEECVKVDVACGELCGYAGGMVQETGTEL